MNKMKLDIQRFAGQSLVYSNGDMSILVYWYSNVVGSTTSEKALYNKSNVGIDLYVRSTNAYSPTWGTFSGYINIDGAGYGFSKYGTAPNNGQWLYIGSASREIQHNDDGTKTIYVGGSVSGPSGTSWSGLTASGGQNVALDTITRMSSINSFVGLADAQSRLNNIEGNFKVEYTRYNIDFTDNLVIEYLNNDTYTTIKTITNYVSGDSFSFTNTELNTLFTNSPTNDIKLRAYLKTYAGQSLIGDSNKITFDASIYDANPTFSDFDSQDVNSTTALLTEDSVIGTLNSVILVDGYSNVKISIPYSKRAIAKKGATIQKYRVVIGSQTLDINYSDSQEVHGTINNSSATVFTVYAIDSRGNSTQVDKHPTSIISYTPLERNTDFKAERDDGGIGGNVTLSFSGNIWNDNFGEVSNGFTTAKYLLKKTDSSTWIDLGASMTDITPTMTNNTFSFSGLIRSDNSDTTWDLQSSYDIKVILEDELSSVEFIVVLASAKPNISLSRNGVGIMCDYDESIGGLLQIGGEPYAMGDTLPIDTVVEYEGSTVPEGFELVEDYSTSEIKTNKVWIDGKPIYRKVVQFTVASAQVAWKSAPHGIQNANASSMRIVEAYIAVNAFGIVNEFVPNQAFQLGIADTNIRYVNHKSESNFDNKTCTCIIEYTKTTD